MAVTPEIQRLVDNLVAGYQPEKVILWYVHSMHSKQLRNGLMEF